jgi:ATP-dependent RNA helicase SUPV3L1/SUV3
LFHPGLLRPAPLAMWTALAQVRGMTPPKLIESLPPVLKGAHPVTGYRNLGTESVRVDSAEKLLRAAHDRRIKAPNRRFALDPALAVSMGLSTAGYARLLRLAGFEVRPPRHLDPNRYGPPAPPLWQWRPPRRRQASAAIRAAPPHGAFAALSEWGV